MKLSTNKKVGNLASRVGGVQNIMRSNTKDEILNQSHLSAPREAYNSNNKID